MTAQERRAAATARRIAAEQAGERGGDPAFEAARRSAPYRGNRRRPRVEAPKAQLRAKMDRRDGKEFVHTEGYYSRYDTPYPMWDQFGEYHEVVLRGAGRKTIAARASVVFLENHRGKSMATTDGGTLILEERDEGGWHDAWLNPARTDVRDLKIAIEDRDMKEMSFAFMIPEGGGWWSEDFTQFLIGEYDMNGGDVSAVNFGANPTTDIGVRTAEILDELEYLPESALRAAEDRLIRRGLSPNARREHIKVREPVVIRRDGSASRSQQRLAAMVAGTGARYVELGRQRGMDLTGLLTAKLPWFEIRNAAGDAESEPGEEPDTATVYVFDEIGGSFGVDAKTFAAELDEITAPKISVRINSPGGSVFDGIAIHSALLHHPAKVRTYIDGLAASAASVIAMGADPYDPESDTGGVVMMPGAELMIHDASMPGNGTAADKEAERIYLDRQSQNLAEMYAGRAGGDAQEWRERMLAETWLFGSEAVAVGLADRVFERPMPVAQDMEERMRRSHDVSGRYRYNRRAAAPNPMQTAVAQTVPLFRGAETLPSGTVRVTAATPETIEDARRPASDRQDQPKGRSIALIEATLATIE